MTNDTLTHDPSTAAPASAQAPAPSGSHSALQVPEGRTKSSVLLEEAYDTYCHLEGTGIAFDRSEFIRGYKPIQSTLGRLIELHHLAKEEGEREVAQIDWTKIREWLRGRYDIECVLGEGKFSRVFLATQPKLGHRRVALKVTWEGDGEAYTLGRIEHPNVISVYGVETLAEQGLSVICMPYEGSATLCSLLDRVLESPVPPPSAAVIHEAASDPHAAAPTPVPESAARMSYEQGIRALFARICDALEALHARDILHRDLKPSNVLFRPDGSPVLLDFNLARDAKAPSSRFGGTFPYMPPEQLRAMAGVADALTQKLDARSDIYSVGALLWETLTGKKPFGDTLHTQTAAECIRELSARQQAGFTAPMPPDWTVSPELASIVRRCLATNPDERPKTAAELRNLLVPPRKVRRPLLIAAALAATMLIAVAGVWAATRPPAPPRENLELAPGGPFYRKALDAVQAGDYDAADKALTLAILEAPKNPRYYRGRAYVAGHRPHLTATQAHQAMSDLWQAKDLGSPEKDKALVGYFVHLSGTSAGAAENYHQAQEKNQGGVALTNNLAALYTSTNRQDDAIALLNDAIARFPRLQALRINRGIARKRKSMALPPGHEQSALRDGAVADLREAIRLGPDSGDLQVQLAMVLAFPEPRDGWHPALARAVELGMDPRTMQGGAAWMHVKDLPQFRALWDLPVGDASQHPKMTRLIPPRPELP